MGNLPFKQHIAELAQLIGYIGIRNIIICPGSRNAPMIQVFQRDRAFACHSIVDERSAGYVALGMATESRKPVVVVTTSGTAVLNLAPAVAEAYNQKIPLVILTADRFAEYPPQFTNQRIQQNKVFESNSGGFLELRPEFDSRDDLENEMNRTLMFLRESCIRKSVPVHINIPLHEPLYETIGESITGEFRHDMQTPEYPVSASQLPAMSDQERTMISEYLSSGRKIMVIAGMTQWRQNCSETINHLITNHKIVVFSENLGNINSDDVITTPDLVFKSADHEDRKIRPEVVIVMGGPVVSKKTRLYIQSLQDVPLIIMNGDPENSLAYLEKLSEQKIEGENDYLQQWKHLEEKSRQMAEAFLEKAPFSNITAIRSIINKIPANSTLHLGNSGTVRYSQLFKARNDLVYRSNRGTSGIDGALSAAVGAAMVSDRQHALILGDLGFVYDSNGLWNRNFPSNLKVIVLNDHGGGIFKLLDGPDRMPFFEEFSVTSHPVHIPLIAQGYGMHYLSVRNKESLNKCLTTLFSNDKEATVLEVDTSECENSGIFKSLYNSID